VVQVAGLEEGLEAAGLPTCGKAEAEHAEVTE